MPKYADPAVYPVTAPAADDTAMARTNAGGDRNFLLGNLAGLAPLVMAADQSAYYNGTTWATYSLTAVGRTFLAATTQAAQRTAIQAVGLVGDEEVNGLKTFNGASYWNFGTSIGSLRYGSPGGFPGILAYQGDYNGATYSRTDIRFQAGLVRIGCSPAGSGNTSPTNFLEVVAAGPNIRPSSDNVMSCGQAERRFVTYWGVNSAINTSDARFKTNPRQLRDAEFKAASAIARLPAVWRWLNRVHGDDNCEPEGMEARKHFGPTVQAAIAVMEAHGLDPFAYSFICYDEWEAQPEQWHDWPATDAVLDDAGNVLEPAVEAGRELVQAAREAGDRYSFRKEELLCFLVAAMARQHDELAERVAVLEAKLTH